MAIKIEKKIKGYAVVRPDEPAAVAAASVPAHDADADAGLPSAEVIQMHERVERPERLEGHTYKIKSPLFEHALYVTINDIVLNEGTEHELRRPYEIFINSKNMEHFQWTVALTRIMSAVFRKGGDVTFLVEELKAVFDPRGGYFKAGGVYMPSIVAELGVVIEDHLRKIGMILGEELSPEQKRLIAEKRAALENRSKKKPEVGAGQGTPSRRQGSGVGGNRISPDLADRPQVPPQADEATVAGFPASASLCAKCNAKAVVMMDGCATCLSCGNSKCG
ncbi:MAG: NrdJb [Pseudoxanthomonas sp.]|nr:NrdJb [Pseudoxanthomonas sp.]